MPPKYNCTICGKQFRRSKQHFNHVMKAHKNTKQGTNKKQIVLVQHIDQELVSLKPEIIHSEPRTTNYIGRVYEGNNIPTGNRHLRSGLPLPTLSKHKYRSQAI